MADFFQSVIAVLKRVIQAAEWKRRTGMFLMAEDVRIQW